MRARTTLKSVDPCFTASFNGIDWWESRTLAPSKVECSVVCCIEVSCREVSIIFGLVSNYSTHEYVTVIVVITIIVVMMFFFVISNTALSSAVHLRYCPIWNKLIINVIQLYCERVILTAKL